MITPKITANKLFSNSVQNDTKISENDIEKKIPLGLKFLPAQRALEKDETAKNDGANSKPVSKTKVIDYKKAVTKNGVRKAARNVLKSGTKKVVATKNENNNSEKHDVKNGGKCHSKKEHKFGAKSDVNDATTGAKSAARDGGKMTKQVTQRHAGKSRKRKASDHGNENELFGAKKRMSFDEVETKAKTLTKAKTSAGLKKIEQTIFFAKKSSPQTSSKTTKLDKSEKPSNINVPATTSYSQQASKIETNHWQMPIENKSMHTVLDEVDKVKYSKPGPLSKKLMKVANHSKDKISEISKSHSSQIIDNNNVAPKCNVDTAAREKFYKTFLPYQLEIKFRLYFDSRFGS